MNPSKSKASDTPGQVGLAEAPIPTHVAPRRATPSGHSSLKQPWRPHHPYEARPTPILYSSGSTAKPKGILHTTGGYLTGAKWTTKYCFDLKDDDVFWCAADVGWVTGHTYIVYGPLSNGATSVMFEGAPDYPAKDIHWQLVEKLGVTIYYFAPTAIRAFMKWDPEYPQKHDLYSLRLLGTGTWFADPPPSPRP